MALAYVALGSNQGERRSVIRRAIQLLGEESRIAITAVSPLIETRPVGGPDDQDTYLNGAIELQTDLAPRVLLIKLLEVEQALGRVRRERWGSRAIDLDLLLYDQDVIELPELCVPHPRMHYRRFVLEPMTRIAPSAMHPTLGLTIQNLFDRMTRSPGFLVLLGLDDFRQKRLFQTLSHRLPAITLEMDCRNSIRYSPPQMLSRHLEFLETYAEYFSRSRFGGFRSPWIISSQWYDLAWIKAQCDLSGSELDQFWDVWSGLRKQVFEATLLIWLNDSGDCVSSGGNRWKPLLATYLKSQIATPVLEVMQEGQLESEIDLVIQSLVS